ncbi:MAG TPA: carboxymuconolactone decarboxylase family protein [Usitatibacter sp.]|jgi:AhpD family alkylhydroperoxidase
MKSRLNLMQVSPDAMKAMRALQSHVDASALEHSLLELVKMRASQVNGCAFCLDMHSKDARAAGESEQRLYVLDGWREAPFYTPRERAALAWTEALTRVSETHAPDDVYEELRGQFSEKEIADLTMAIVAINGWNRIAIGLRSPVGTYQPAKAKTA